LILSNLNAAIAGNYSVVVSAEGGSVTSSVASLTVDRWSASLVLTSPENPAGYADPLDFTASLLPTNASGSVQFLTNGILFDTAPVLAGQAVSTNLLSLPRGTNVVAAVYSGDLVYLPVTNWFAQVVTNHPPTATAALYTNSLGAPLAMAVADLQTHWSDVDGDTVFLVAVGVSTNGIVLTRSGGMLLYSNLDNVADQFVCTIADGWGGTNFQTVFIVPAPPPDATPGIVGVQGGGSQGVTLNLSGAFGQTYLLEATTNLMLGGPWQPLATNTLGTSGLWQFSDTQATNYPLRFYRLKLVQ
jgi:hypothetical protein